MRIQRIIPFAFGLCLLTLGNGCATKALWESDYLEAWKQPDTNPNLRRLFRAKHPNDILVVYDGNTASAAMRLTRAPIG